MLEATLSTARPSPDLKGPLAALRARVADAAKPAAAATAAVESKPTLVESQAQARRQALKQQAQDRVHALIERLKVIKKFASDDPRVMAKQLAQLVKELKAALKAYVDAGGTPRGVGAAAAMTAPPPPSAPPSTDAASAEPEGTDAAPAETTQASPAAAPVDPTASTEAAKVRAVDAESRAQTLAAARSGLPGGAYADMKDQLGSSEAAGDMHFLKTVRGFGKAIRELLDRAKIQMAFKPMDDDTAEAFKSAAQGLKEIDKALDKMDREIRLSSPAAGLFIDMVA